MWDEEEMEWVVDSNIESFTLPKAIHEVQFQSGIDQFMTGKIPLVCRSKLKLANMISRILFGVREWLLTMVLVASKYLLTQHMAQHLAQCARPSALTPWKVKRINKSLLINQFFLIMCRHDSGQGVACQTTQHHFDDAMHAHTHSHTLIFLHSALFISHTFVVNMLIATCLFDCQ